MKITPKSSLNTDPLVRPYMHYNDTPMRPRLHFWFGPLSMVAFLTADNDASPNMWPGTCHEAQCWQLKAGVRSALDDIKKNHPNDWASLIYFSGINGYATPRVTLGRNYTRMKNALFFPLSLLDQLGDPAVEMRPYDTNFSYVGSGDIPNAAGSTAPEMAFKVAYNQFSTANGGVGRKGATKVVVFETDGIPNTPGYGDFDNTGGPYNSFYDAISAGANIGNNDPTVVSRAIAAANQICAQDTATNPGYSTSRNPARVHAIGFGSIFESGSTLRDDALGFLAQVQVAGYTSPTGTTWSGYETAEPYKVVYGTATERIEKLRQALERIMQSGVQVSLIR